MMKSAALAAALAVVACGGGDEQPSTVSVVKSLNSLQCTGGGPTVGVLQSQLSGAGVQVVASFCGIDAVPRASVCGLSDGAIAIFEVPASQQAQAEALGFVPLSAVPAAFKRACS